MPHSSHLQKLSAAGMLVTLGIIFGDIGTSPLYVFSAIIGESIITQDLVYGGISCVFWTLTLQTTIKYVMITLNADNKGEGGVFSLYQLLRRRYKHLIIAAMVGGGMALADGIITPAISVSSAVEGLTIINPDIPTVGSACWLYWASKESWSIRMCFRLLTPCMPTACWSNIRVESPCWVRFFFVPPGQNLCTATSATAAKSISRYPGFS